MTFVQLPRKRKSSSEQALDLNPDGVRILVSWDEIEPGMSIFVPAIDVYECIAQVYRITRRREWYVGHACRVEGGRLGVRFWRIL